MSKSLCAVLILFLCLLLSLNVLPPAFAAEEAASSGDRETLVGAENSLPYVTFLCDQAQMLSNLSVYDSSDRLCAPLTDAKTGKPRYGCYQLDAGEYRYLFRDDNGFYEAQEDSFSVDAAIYAYCFQLPLIPARKIYSFTYTYVNPIYDDIVRESDIPKVSDSEEARIEELLAFAGKQDRSGSRSSERYNAESGVRNTTVEAAGQELKEQIMDFEETATVHLIVEGEPTAYDWRELCGTIFAVAIAHTGVPTEGDYLRYEYGGYNATGNILSEDGRYVCLFKYTLYHFTNAGQEAEVTTVVKRVLSELTLDGKSDYVKIRAIYDYLCANVSYGGSDDLQNTAYGALVDHLCVCQGYATAFYRLCLASGIDARVITRSGNPNNHAWNIVRLDERYYEADAAWDQKYYGKAYSYFLRGSNYWLTTTHNTLGDQFLDGAFSDRYALPAYDYVSYDTPGLEKGLKGLDAIVASISAHQVDGNIERFRVALAVDAVEAVSGGVCAFEVYPRVAAYSGESIVAQERAGNDLLVDGSLFSVRLPVPDSWAERQAVYTLSSAGYDDVKAYVDITRDDDGCIAQLDELHRFGQLSLSLLCRVSFDPGNGQPPLTVLAPTGGPVERPVTPTREGYWFGGWYEAGSDAPFDFENTLISTDISLSGKWLVPDFALPDALSAIGDGAFAGVAARFVKLSERTTTISRRAFADCPNLAFIYIPEGTLTIDPEAFSGIHDLTVIGKAGSPAEKYADVMRFHFLTIF